VQAIARELAEFSAELAAKPRWLVINKTDLLNTEDLAAARERLLQTLQWSDPVFELSAATGAGTDALGHAVMQHLESINEDERTAEEYDPSAR